MNGLAIRDLDKLKFTSIKFNGNIIHFRYDNQNYFLRTNWDFGETPYTQLYKGRCKSKNNTCIKSKCGFIKNLIEYKYNRRNLSSIDKYNFVKKLYKAGFIESAPIEIEKICKLEDKFYELSIEINKVARMFGDSYKERIIGK